MHEPKVFVVITVTIKMECSDVKMMFIDKLKRATYRHPQ